MSPQPQTKDPQSPSAVLRNCLTDLIARRSLDTRQVARTFEALASPKSEPVLRAAVLAALGAKGVSADEMRGFAEAMLAAARGPIPYHGELLVDTCGTGGDGSGSFNISSACSLLVASMGIPVAKHGNRSISSRSGSADFFRALGIEAPSDPAGVARALREQGFAFVSAPHFHPAMANLAQVRRALGIPTLFNQLGPLVNPARPTHQLLGCTSPAKALRMAQALAGMQVRRAFVVTGHLGWDEATPCGPFQLFDVHAGAVQQRELEPAQFGLPSCDPSELRAGDAEHNAELFRGLLRGEAGALQDAVVLNAALVSMLVGASENPHQASQNARAALISGRTQSFVRKLTQTNL